MNLAQIYADKHSKLKKEQISTELFRQLLHELSTSLGIPQQFIEPEAPMILPRRSSTSAAETIVASYVLTADVPNRNRNVYHYDSSAITFQNGSEIRSVPLEVRERTLPPAMNIINPKAIASFRFDR